MLLLLQPSWDLCSLHVKQGGHEGRVEGGDGVSHAGNGSTEYGARRCGRRGEGGLLLLQAGGVMRGLNVG